MKLYIVTWTKYEVLKKQKLRLDYSTVQFSLELSSRINYNHFRPSDQDFVENIKVIIKLH